MTPTPPAGARPRILLVGGGLGLVGRALVEEFRSDHWIRSLHRRPSAAELVQGLEVVRADVGYVVDWTPILEGVDLVLNVAWYRAGPDRKFRRLAAGLEGLIRASEKQGVRRFLHLSVPPAPPELEAHLPYLVRKRQVDAALARSELDYVIVRPTMLFGPRDKLLTVMLRTISRWHRFPLFGDGEYHVSPLAARDLAHIVRRELTLGGRRTVDAGGPERWRYLDLTHRLFDALGVPPKYVRLSPRGGRRLARFLETFGSSLLYAYEVDWLVSDLLGLVPYAGLDRPLTPVDGFVRAEAARLSAPKGTVSAGGEG
jgi:uncharacterized protein YbjT (DUF2867 family)